MTFYSERRGFDAINIPIDQVISRDKQAAASEIRHLEGNQKFLSNQQQLRLVALGNKHATEEKIRDTNFRFMQDNYERIHKAETQEFEQRIKDAGQNRHIEDFGEKLIAAIPGIVDMIPQIVGVVQEAQAEKAKAEQDWATDWTLQQGYSPEEMQKITASVDTIKEGGEAYQEFVKTLHKEGHPDIRQEDLLRYAQMDPALKLAGMKLGIQRLHTQYDGFVSGEGLKEGIVKYGDGLDGRHAFESSQNLEAYLLEAHKMVFNEYRGSAAANVYMHELYQGTRASLYGEFGRITRKKTAQQIKLTQATNLETAVYGKDGAVNTAKFIVESSTTINPETGKLTMTRETQDNTIKVLKEFIDLGIIDHSLMVDVLESKVKFKGKYLSLGEHFKKSKYGAELSQLVVDAQKVTQSNYNHAQAVKLLGQSQNFKTIKSQLGTQEGKQTWTPARLQQMVKQESITPEQYNNLTSLNSWASKQTPLQGLEYNKSYKLDNTNLKEEIETWLSEPPNHVEKTHGRKASELKKRTGFGTAVTFGWRATLRKMDKIREDNPNITDTDLYAAGREYFKESLYPHLLPTNPGRDKEGGGMEATPLTSIEYPTGMSEDGANEGASINATIDAITEGVGKGKTPPEVASTYLAYKSPVQKIRLDMMADKVVIANRRQDEYESADLRFITEDPFVKENARLHKMSPTGWFNTQLIQAGKEPLVPQLEVTLEEQSRLSKTTQRGNQSVAGIVAKNTNSDGVYRAPQLNPGVQLQSATQNNLTYTGDRDGRQTGTDFHLKGGQGAPISLPFEVTVRSKSNIDGFPTTFLQGTPGREGASGSGFGNSVFVEITLPNGKTGELMLGHLDEESPLANLADGTVLPPGTLIGKQGASGRSLTPGGGAYDHITAHWDVQDGSGTPDELMWILNALVASSEGLTL